jgi:hypothetical protein
MLNMVAKFATVAQAVSAAYGGPYYDALVHSAGEPVFDSGGSIVTPGIASSWTCQAQVDSVTQDMRQAEGYTDADMRILVLADTLAGAITLDNTIEVLAGPHAGAWMIASINRDPFGVYWELRGRRAN